MKTITDFINNEYKEYANYVLQSRAIPSLIDGFKPSQRKIMYTAMKSCRNRKIKTAALSGTVISDANFHHGNASLDGTISLMAADWKNNVPLLEGEGNFGSRLINEPAAARYTFVRLHSNFDKYFIDRDLLEYYKSPDPEDPEPTTFLPLIPWVLVPGVKGIAVGYATEIQPYNIKDLKSICVKYLRGHKIENVELLPHFDNFDGIVYSANDQVYADGSITINSPTKITITELPPGVERETYISKVLNKLEDDNKIVSYVDKCTDSKFKFEIKLRRGTKYNEDKLIKMFKLSTKLNENLTTIDERGQLAIFENKYEIIKHFCDWRLEQFKVRYDHYVKRDTKKLEEVELKIRYINDINNNRIDFKALTKKQLLTRLVELDYNGTSEQLNSLTSMPTYNLTKDHLKSLEDKKAELIDNIQAWKTIDHKEQYIKELKKL